MDETTDNLVYAAEESMLVRHGDRRFDSLADVREYVRVLILQDWFRRRWPQPLRFRIGDGRGHQGCATCHSVDGRVFNLRFPRKKFTEFIVLHEVAHAVTWDRAHHDHGLLFREALLVRVRRRMGPAAARLLLREWCMAGLAM
jgi:putative metallohydrolase (TIGR04338 family)